MYKKFISSILLIAFLNLLGCYSFKSVTIPEFKKVEEKENKPNEFYVKSKDSQEYHFSDSDFYIENDTLYGKEILRIDNRPPYEEYQLDRKIALSDIESIEIKSFNLTATTLLLLPFAFVAFFFIISMIYPPKFEFQK